MSSVSRYGTVNCPSISNEEGTDCKLIGIHSLGMMSKPKHLLAIHQWVSFIYFLASEVNLYTMITFLANLLEDTHTCASFHSTGRWFQMFPKRMKGREAPHSPTLDSTRSWKPASWNRPGLHTVCSSLATPRRRPIFVIYLPRMCQARGEEEGSDVPIVKHNKAPW